MWSLVLFCVVFVGNLGNLNAIICNNGTNKDIKPSKTLYNIEKCKSKILRDEDTSFQGVVYIVADNNLIKALDNDTFKDGESLTHIDLRFNQIKTIEVGTFDKTTKLALLYLRNNKITNLEPGVFRGLTNLKHLWLQSNQIRILENGLFADQNNLAELLFNDNKIVGIGSTAFLPNINIKHGSFLRNVCMNKSEDKGIPNITSYVEPKCVSFYEGNENAINETKNITKTLNDHINKIKKETDGLGIKECQDSKSDLDNPSWLITAMAGEAIVIMGIITILVVWKCTTLMEGKEFGEVSVQSPAAAPARDDGLIYAELELRGGTSRPPPSPRNDEVIYAGIK
jgi:hypothetical protein